MTEKLAALMYYEDHGTEKSFESLTPEAQQKYTTRVQNILVMIDKLNMKVVTTTSIRALEEKLQVSTDARFEIIKAWRNELRHPKNIGLYLNDDVCRELAKRLT